MKEFYFSIDIKRKVNISRIEVVSGDTETNIFHINLIENSQVFNLSGYSVKLAFQKPDMTTVFQDATIIDVNAGEIMCTLRSQVLATIGVVLFEIVLYGANNQRITTPQQQLEVKKGLLNENTIESSNEFTALTQAVSTVTQYDNRIINIEGRTTNNEINVNILDDKIGNLSTLGVNSVVEKFNQIDSALNDMAISPEKFSGNDFQKVQQALDYAITNRVAVRFSRMYDITGLGTLQINKSQTSFSTDRRVLFLFGQGGGIKKNDAGAIFSAPYTDVGDIDILNMKYESTTGVGTIVFDCDKLIRIKSSHCKYLNVDTIASAPTRYFQSIDFSNENITGGSGWKFETKLYIDTTIKDCLIEYCANGIRNIATTEIIMNSNLRIIDNLIEDLTGKAIQVGAMSGGEISGNYFEDNEGGYVDLATVNNSYHYALVVSKNTFNVTSIQLANNTPCITWGTLYGGGSYGCGACVSMGNKGEGLLHSISITNGAYVIGIGDYASNVLISGTTGSYISLDKPYSKSNTDGSVMKIWGMITKITNSVSVTLAAGSSQYVDVPIGVTTISGTDEVSAHPNANNDINIQSCAITTSHNVNVLVNNTGTVSRTFTLYVYVTKLSIPASF